MPSIEQQAYQHVELTAFLHLGLDTFDGTEQGNTSDTPMVFAPTALTQAAVDHWVTALQGAGFGQAMLVTKHSTGFCLWPSTSTDYTVANSGWMNGMGDVVKMFASSAAAHGMRTALYLSPWDQHFPSSDQTYQAGYTTQQMELLSNYGNVYEIEYDGFNSPGSHGTPPTVDWVGVFQAAKKLQPHINIWSGPEISQQTGKATPPVFPDLQWIGNEQGMASPATSSLVLPNTTTAGLQCVFVLDSSGNPTIQVGMNIWCPNEATTSSYGSSWFWHPGNTPISVQDMEQVYFNTVGHNATVNFNVPPSQTGDFDTNEDNLLTGFGTWYHSTFKTNLVKGAPAMADSTWATAGFDASKADDDDVCTYWAAASGMTTGTLTLTPASAINLNVISIREPIEMGERVTKYHVEIEQNGSWTTPSDKMSNMVQGTVIGNRQLWQMSGQSVTGIRLVVESARDLPLIAEFAAY